MKKRHSLDDLSLTEIEQHLYRQKRRQRHQRIQRLKAAGRVADVDGRPPPDALSVAIATRHLTDEAELIKQPEPISRRRWLANKSLLLVEITAVIGIFIVFFNLWRTQSSLNQELAQIQRSQSQALVPLTPLPTPVIDVAILPGGHKAPVEGVIPQPGEAGDIPPHLLPAINAYQPPPQPTPFPEMARRIQIPAINVDSPIVQGMYDWEQLKKGVAQKIDSAGPGEVGNMSLAAHNDIYGEIFRYLDQLSPGDEIIISTERQTYTYIVREIAVVEPTDVSVLNPTNYPSTTLISCYPYRVNTQRIVVFADLVEA